MSPTLLGAIAVVIGVVFCFGGHRILRFVIALWGAFAGFNLGAGLVASLGDRPFLDSGLGWVAGILLAVVFAALAYFFYAAAVILALGSIGFALGAGLAAAMGVSWDWLVVLVGVVLGVLVAFLAMALDVPTVLLVVLSAAGGATVMVTGLMLFTGTLERLDLEGAAAVLRGSPWWYLLEIGLFVVGVLRQLRHSTRRAGARAAWSGTTSSSPGAAP